MGSRSLRFARAARVLGDEARRSGHVVPSFRSPPRQPDRDRTIRRRPDGSVAVAVRLDGRPFVAVLADMVEGLVAANGAPSPSADELRRRAWNALERVEPTEVATRADAA